MLLIICTNTISKIAKQKAYGYFNQRYIKVKIFPWETKELRSQSRGHNVNLDLLHEKAKQPASGEQKEETELAKHRW